MTFVADFHQDGSLLHVFQVRRILESAATSLAAQLITDEELETLGESVEGMDTCDTVEAFVEADLAFHRTIAIASRNPVLASLLESFATRTSRARLRRGITQADAIEQTKTDHRAIYDALRHRRPDLAGGARDRAHRQRRGLVRADRSVNRRRRSWRNVRAMDELRALRDGLLEHREDWEAATRVVRLAGARRVQLGARLVRPVRARKRRDGLAGRRGRRERAAADVRRAGDALGSGSRTGCATQGVARGDRIVLMLGNQVELWETMLAAIKLGAVVIPATTLLAESDLRDRIDRGQARHVIVRAADAAKFDGVPGDYTRIAVGGAVDGWLDYALGVLGAGVVRAGRRDPRLGHAAPVLHVGHDRAAEARRAHARVVSGRAPVDDVLARAEAR